MVEICECIEQSLAQQRRRRVVPIGIVTPVDVEVDLAVDPVPVRERGLAEARARTIALLTIIYHRTQTHPSPVFYPKRTLFLVKSTECSIVWLNTFRIHKHENSGSSKIPDRVTRIHEHTCNNSYP